MRTFSYGLIAVALVSLLALAGLRHKADGQEQNRIISVKGVIAEILPTGGDDGDVEGKLLIEGQLENDPQYNRLVAAVLSQTRIRRNNDPSWVGNLSDLTIGRPVEVWFQEPVWVTYPPQVKAQTIQIRD